MPGPPSNASLIGPSSVAGGATSTDFTIIPAINITGTYTMIDSGYGGTFTPPSLTWAADSTPKTFKYNAPNTPGIATITPVWSGGSVVTDPPFLLITVTGANATQHIYQMPQIAGVPPFQILATNNQIPAAAMPAPAAVPQHLYQFPMFSRVPPFGIVITNNQIPAAITPPVVPPTTTTYGTIEAGGGTVAALAAGATVTLIGTMQTPVRDPLRKTFFAAANGTFDLDYQFTTDGGTSWYTGKEVASSVVSADGTTYLNAAHFKITTGFQWRVVITNTSAPAINVAYEHRLFSRGKRSS